MDRGYFKEQGITMEVVPFRTTAEAIAPLGTGQIDILVGSLSQALLAAADRDIQLKIVADKSQSLLQWETAYILLRKDLADSGKVKSAADLRGMKVAIPSKGSMGEQVVQRALEQDGLKPSDVETVLLSGADQAPAFANKAIAASFAFEPFVAAGTQQGFATKWIGSSKLFGGKLELATVVYGASLLKDQDLGRRWMIAYLRGARDFLKAFSAKEGRDQVINILAKYTTVTDPKLYDIMELPYLDPNGQIDKSSMDVQYKWFVDMGLYTGKRTFGDITDLSFAEYASQKLGKQ